jgi:hypothetical protein
MSLVKRGEGRVSERAQRTAGHNYCSGRLGKNGADPFWKTVKDQAGIVAIVAQVRRGTPKLRIFVEKEKGEGTCSRVTKPERKRDTKRENERQNRTEQNRETKRERERCHSYLE